MSVFRKKSFRNKTFSKITSQGTCSKTITQQDSSERRETMDSGEKEWRKGNGSVMYMCNYNKLFSWVLQSIYDDWKGKLFFFKLSDGVFSMY